MTVFLFMLVFFSVLHFSSRFIQVLSIHYVQLSLYRLIKNKINFHLLALVLSSMINEKGSPESLASLSFVTPTPSTSPLLHDKFMKRDSTEVSCTGVGVRHGTYHFLIVDDRYNCVCLILSDCPEQFSRSVMFIISSHVQ